MIIDPVYGKMDNAVNIPDGTILDEGFKLIIWQVRNYIRGQAPGYMKLKEIHFTSFPTDEEIMYHLVKNNGNEATIEKVYTLGKLPFTEDIN